MRSTNLTLSILALVLVSIGAGVAHAGLPEAGKVYEGPKSFSSEADGLAFAFPKGWVGGLDGEFFGIMDKADQGKNGVVLLWSSEGTLDEARKSMSADLPVMGAVLKLKSKLVTRKNVLSATYSVVGGAALSEATITTRVAHGKIVAVIAAYSPSGKKKMEGLSKAVISSLKISKDKVVQATAVASTDTWQAWLSGARLTRFSSGSGYSEKESYTFCPDGSFRRSFEAGSSSVNGSGAALANNSGRWSASGTGAKGVVTLHFANDTVDRSAIEYRDRKTYWGGTRYFRETNQCN